MTNFFALVALLVSVASAAFAEPRTCEGLFNETSVRSRLTAKVNELAELKNRLIAPPFRIALFDEALAEYSANGPSALKQLSTREGKLAFVTYLANLDGRDPYELELIARSRDPRTLSRLVRTFGRIDADSISPEQIDDIFEKIMRYREPRALGFKTLWKQGWSQIDKTTLRQWATKEIASHGVKTAAERLGLLQTSSGLRGVRDRLRADPNVVHAISSTSFNLFLMMTGGLPIAIPEHSRLQVTRLDPALRELIETQGFDAAYPVLKARYGGRARFDQAFFLARRAATTALMTYMIIAYYPALLQSLAPGLVDDQDGVWKMTKLVLGFYASLTTSVVEYEFDKYRHHQEAKANSSTSATPFRSRTSRNRNPAPTPHAVAPVDDEKPLAKPINVTTFDDDLKIGTDARPKSSRDSDDDRQLQATLDTLSNTSFEDPTDH